MPMINSDDLYKCEKTPDKLYEVRELNLYTAIIFSYPEQTSANYSVITMPHIFNGNLDWRSKYDNFTLAEAKKRTKEIECMYSKIENNRIVTSTAKDIEKNISDSMGELYHYDMQKAYDKTAEIHSEFDIALTVALSIKAKYYDGRFSPINKSWADNFIETNRINREDYKNFYGCNAHSTLLDGFTDTVRENISNKTVKQLQGSNEDIILTEEQNNTLKR